jgi:SAM-dependent methyltransferase
MTELTDYEAGGLYYEPGELGWYDDLWAGAGPAYDRAYGSAFPPGEYAGQQGTMSVSEILDLAESAGVNSGTRILDLCCGPGGPAILLAKKFGCRVIGVDASPEAVRQASLRTRRSRCAPPPGFRAADALNLPFGRERFDVVFLLETLPAFPGKKDIFREAARVLPYRGRLAISAEVGSISGGESAGFPGDSPIFLLTRPDLLQELAAAGLRLLSVSDRTAEHASTAAGISRALMSSGRDLSNEVGSKTLTDIAAGLAMWGRLYRSGRVHKLLIVLEKDNHTNWARVI